MERETGGEVEYVYIRTKLLISKWIYWRLNVEKNKRRFLYFIFFIFSIFLIYYSSDISIFLHFHFIFLHFIFIFAHFCECIRLTIWSFKTFIPIFYVDFFHLLMFIYYWYYNSLEKEVIFVQNVGDFVNKI